MSNYDSCFHPRIALCRQLLLMQQVLMNVIVAIQFPNITDNPDGADNPDIEVNSFLSH